MMMEKTILRMRPDQKKKLIQLAKHNQVSVAEMNRRVIDAYESENEIGQAELDELVDRLVQFNEQAELAINEARAEIKETLLYFQDRKNNHVSE